MSISQIVFYLIAALILVFGVLSVTTRHIFRAAIYLLFTLVNVAALFFFLNYEFLAAVQISVYVGGIVVLILFSLFLTQQIQIELPKYPLKRTIAAIGAILFGFGFTFSLLCAHVFPAAATSNTEVQMSAIGMQLLNYGNGGYILPFEAVSILLLAAMIGCISIGLKTTKND
jgi:NADH-quinone oxidoreductase subunit J